MNIMNKKISLVSIKKLFNRKGLVLIKKKQYIISKNKSLDILLRSLLSSIIVISFFTVMPTIIEFSNEQALFSKDYENNSKDNFKKALENENAQLDKGLDQKFLFDDVLNYEDLPTDTVRLSASTIEQLFKDTKYNLDDVRKKKLVKPVSLSLLPEEMKMIENTKKRKELFIQIILPLIIKENNNIRLDRKKLFSILNKSKNSSAEKKWLDKKFKQYGVLNKDLSTLKVRLDEIPVSLAIAQAAKETGWGTSRFAQEGNALFG